MHVAYVELRFYFIVCHVTVQGRWKGTCDVVINLGMIVSVDRREQQNQEDHNPYFIMFGDKGGRFIQAFYQRFVSRFLNCLVKYQNHGRQDGDTADNADQNTFCHNDTKVAAKGKGHNTQCQETGYGGNGASGYGFERVGDCMAHRTLFVIRETLFILLEAVQQEDGVVHRNTKLQHGGQRFCDVGSLTKEHVASQVVKDCKSDT